MLYAKLGKEMKEILYLVTRLVNFVLEISSLQHCIFRALLKEMSAEHTGLLHNNVHWLRKGHVLEWVCDLHDELVSFLSGLKSHKAHNFQAFLRDRKDVMFFLFFFE